MLITVLIFLYFTQPNINTLILEQKKKQPWFYFVPGFADLYFERIAIAHKPEAIQEVRTLLCFSLGYIRPEPGETEPSRRCNGPDPDSVQILLAEGYLAVLIVRTGAAAHTLANLFLTKSINQSLLTWDSQIRSVFGPLGSVMVVFVSCHLPWVGLTSTGSVNISHGGQHVVPEPDDLLSVTEQRTNCSPDPGRSWTESSIVCFRHFRQSGSVRSQTVLNNSLQRFCRSYCLFSFESGLC